MIGNTVNLHHFYKIILPKALEGGTAKMRILGNEIIRAAIEIGEIAASAAGNPNLFAYVLRVLKDDDIASFLTGLPHINLRHRPR